MATAMMMPILMALVGIPWLAVSGQVAKDGWGKTSLALVWAIGAFFTGAPGLFLYLAFGGS